MIKINLLPPEVKKAQKQKAKKPVAFHAPKLGPKLIKAGIYSLSVLIGFHLILGISILIEGISLKNAGLKWGQLQPDRAEIERVAKEVASIEKFTAPVKELYDKRILWSKELNELSNSITPGVWLSRLFIETQVKNAQKGESQRVLNLEGRASSLYGDETALVAKFIKSLQENKDFFRYFNDIKLGPMETAAVENNPVMNFRVFCYFKDKGKQ